MENGNIPGNIVGDIIGNTIGNIKKPVQLKQHPATVVPVINQAKQIHLVIRL